MSWTTTVLLVLALAVGSTGCFVVDARQTLRHLDDGRTLFASGRRDICLRIEDAAGEVVDEDCEIVEDPLGMAEHALFDTADGYILVGVAPVDVTEVMLTADGGGVEVELVESDLVTRFYLAELPGDARTVTVVGRTEAGEPVDDPVTIEVGTGG